MNELKVSEAINNRVSTRQMDPKKKIPKIEMDQIIDAGLKAPNGFGVEA